MKINEELAWKLITYYTHSENLKEFDLLAEVQEDIVNDNPEMLSSLEVEMLTNKIVEASKHSSFDSWYEVELNRKGKIAVIEFEERDDAFASYMHYKNQPIIKADIYSVSRGIRDRI